MPPRHPPPPELLQRIAERLRARRLAAGLTQEQLAELAQVQAETVSRLENGRQQPSIGMVWALASALGKVFGRTRYRDVRHIFFMALATAPIFPGCVVPTRTMRILLSMFSTNDKQILTSASAKKTLSRSQLNPNLRQESAMLPHPRARFPSTANIVNR